ncbi:MAG: hypothetical protein SFW64_00230 [Alphaproteobacteria bacterium]|nr:hypothetical protein [Alphaproteobacteria bacterium]
MDKDDIYNLDDNAAGVAATAPDEMRHENADGSVTLTLKYPPRVKFRREGEERDETIRELRIRRANGGDLRQVIRFQKDEEKVVMLLFVRLTGYPDPVFDKLDAEDAMRFFAEVQDFLERALPTGKK